MTQLTTEFQSALDKKQQDGARADAFDNIIKALQKQLDLYTKYQTTRDERAEEYTRVEESYQRERALFNKNKPEGYVSYVHDGGSFNVQSLGATLLNMHGERHKPLKRNYEVSRGDYINVKKMREHEADIMHGLSRILPDAAEAVADVFYRDLPAYTTAETKGNLASVKANYYTGIDKWSPEYIELSAASVAIKLESPQLIKAQLDLVKRMKAAPNPLQPREPFSVSRFFKNLLP